MCIRDRSSILFGDAIGVSRADVVLTGIAAGASLLAVVVGYRAFLVVTFSQDKAASLGLRPGVVHVTMLVLVAVAVVASFRTVGTLLVFALLIAPPATASLVSRRVPMMIATAVGLGSLSVVTGLLVSFRWGVAASPAIAVTAVALFFLVLSLREVASWVHGTRRRRYA